MFALARSHTNRCEPFEQFNVVKPLLGGVKEVLKLEVFIEIDKVLSLGMFDDGKGVGREVGSGESGVGSREGEF